MGNYPTEEQLEKIKNWPILGIDNVDYKDLMAYVRELWEYGNWGFEDNGDGVYALHTGGWSGNESIIGALEQNMMFWMIYWVQSMRGGHYVFGPPHLMVTHEELLRNQVDKLTGALRVLRSVAEGDEYARLFPSQVPEDARRIEAAIRAMQEKLKALPEQGSGDVDAVGADTES